MSIVVFNKYLLDQIYSRELKLGLSENGFLLTNNFNGSNYLI